MPGKALGGVPGGPEEGVFQEVEVTSWRSSGSWQLNLGVLPQGWKVGLAGEWAERLQGNSWPRWLRSNASSSH